MPPFPGPLLTGQRVLNGEYTFPEHVPLTENCKELLASILEVEPAKRLGLSAIWDHPWMAGAGYKRAVRPPFRSHPSSSLGG